MTMLVFAATARAQTPAGDPMTKRVTLHARDVSLRDALDRLAAITGVRISYSGDNLPLDRRVEVARDTASLADVLRELLRAFPVEPVAVGGDHIVLAPRHRDAPAADSARRPVAMLDRVVVTGSVLGGPERQVPVALDIVSGRDVERRDQTSLSQVLDGSIPGVFMWEPGPTSILARYASVRGASSFGISAPKVYIDGIEVANPLVMTQISPELIERIEVIRGPQGAALYGADAISGVINIVSRHDGAGTEGVDVKLRTQGGYANAYNAHAIPVQEHGATLRVGSNLRSAGLNVGVASTGEYIPEAFSREYKANGDVRFIGASSTITASARFFDKDANVPLSPLLPPRKFSLDTNPQRLRMYSLGSTYTRMASDQWTYALTAGLDGYSMTDVAIDGPIAFVIDTTQKSAGGSALRGTLRASAVSKTGAPDRVQTTLTFAVENSTLRSRSLQQVADSAGTRLEYVPEKSGSIGFTAQANVGIRDALFLTGGLRNEHIEQAEGQSQFATLPMLGLAWVREARGVTAKLRMAYGRGVRAARASTAPVEPKHRIPNASLSPEQQSGTEAGFDVMFGRRVAVHVTRFDQLASGLVQNVALARPSFGGEPRFVSQLQNVGEISNRGWETSANAAFGMLSLNGAAAFVDSRVRRVAAGYTGDLAAGDRMLGVPSRTLSATATLTRRRMQVATTLSRASDWVNYDRLTIAQRIDSRSITEMGLVGPALRQFWIEYPGSTRLRSAVSVELPRGFTLVTTGENLLNHQTGEPDSITIVPGRTITVGLRARF